MPEIDYYHLLGLDTNATGAQIRRAFRTLALRCHPDQNPNDPGAEERFKLITQAYKVLIDPRKRSQYDRARSAAQAQRNRESGRVRERAGSRAHRRETRTPTGESVTQTPPPTDMPADSSRRRPWWQDDLERIKAAPPPPPPPPPKPPPVETNDLLADVTISREMAELGGGQPLAVSHFEKCSVCEGIGARPGTVVRSCPECDPQQPSPGCSLCKGRGRLFQSPCAACFGKGQARVNQTVVVMVPPGSQDNQTIRLSGHGKPGSEEGKAGDLVVKLHVKAESEYEQRDASIYSEIHVTPSLAALGGAVRVKTIDTWIEMVVPPGTRSGTVFRLEGKGPMRADGERGDHYVTVKIVAP